MSESLEMYLSTIVQLREGPQTPVPLSQLADALSISSVSANEMCRKLQEQELVIYKPYVGVTLTEQGERQGCLVLRRRGLWTVFLSQELDISPQRAWEIADKLEHDTPDEVADRLDAFLKHPRVTPLGTPIPSFSSKQLSPRAVPLAELSVGQTGYVASLEGGSAVHDFLSGQGLAPGTVVRILAVTADGGYLIDLGGGRRLSLHADLARDIHVILDKPDRACGAAVPAAGTAASVRVIPLSKLGKGEQGIIVRVNCRGALRQRILDMGIVTGETIRLRHRAPLGDPLEFELKGYQLSLRKEEAEEIIVEVASST